VAVPSSPSAAPGTTGPTAKGTPATPGSAGPALRIGPLVVEPPVVLAPMAGVTNPAFRRLCRQFGAGLYVSEMITARGLIEGSDRTREMTAFDPDESPRSIQLYGSDPTVMAAAVAQLVETDHVDHIDLNLGCPVRKVTRHGGGAALTARPRLLERLIGGAVGAAGAVPVTVKFRLGIDETLTTYLDTGRVAEDAGAAAVALHARSAAQLYSGTADWDAIARLKQAVASIPVLGNGDIWSADDALRMQRETGCDGVVIGRGCLGRPWLFRDLADAFAGRPVAPPPPFGVVADVLIHHVELLAARVGEDRALRDIRKHVAWYLTGYPVGPALRRTLTTTTSFAQFRAELAGVDRGLALPREHWNQPRGTRRGPQGVTLPDRWLEDRESDQAPGALADALTSGG
jgi:nifR3 family TIM-barrel protein